MKKILFLVFVFLFFLIPHPVSADEGWIINNFDSNIQIESNGEVNVLETLNVDFNTLSKHGIFRDIPYVYEKDGIRTYTQINVENVLQNGRKAKYNVSLSDGYVRIKIGDPDKTISGQNSYEINYIARGVLRGFSDHDELYWNTTGNNWPVSIAHSTAKVNIPKDGLKKAICFEGYTGSNLECKSTLESQNTAKFESNGVLDESQGMTIAVAYTKGMVPILKVDKPKTFFEKFIDWPSLTTLLILIVSGIGTIIYLWNKNGRDYWFGSGVFGKRNELGAVKPIGAHETTVVEYTPPENLRPAEIGVLMDEKADTLDVVSTIIDLAARGYLKIAEIDKKWIFGKTDFSLEKIEKSDSDLRNYERILLEKIFEGGTSVTVSSLKNSFYTDLKMVKDALYDEVVTKNLFPSNPEKIRQKYQSTAILLIFFSVFLIGWVISMSGVFFADILSGVFISGVILLIFSKFMPRRTAYGRDLYRKTKGYRLFIDKAETHRQKFFEKKNLFNEVLPYAIVFGLTEKFAKAMGEIGIKPTQTGWYSGTHAFSASHFGSSMDSFSNSLSSAIASTPSSSGGFSGGSSGGGGGGGGGGSW